MDLTIFASWDSVIMYLVGFILIALNPLAGSSDMGLDPLLRILHDIPVAEAFSCLGNHKPAITGDIAIVSADPGPLKRATTAARLAGVYFVVM